MALSLNILAKALFPSSIYEKLVASSIAKRLIRGSIWSVFGAAISRILTLVAMILTARVLMQVSYGEFGLIQATLGVAGVMAGMGLGTTATRFVSQYATTDPARAGRIIALVMSVSIGAVLLAATVLVAASGFIAQRIFEASHLQSPLIWGSLLMAAKAFRGIQNGVLAGLEKFDIIAKLSIIDGMISLASVVPLAQFFGVKGALIGFALGASLSWLVGRVLLTIELRKRRIVVYYTGCLTDRGILTGYSLPNLLANLLAVPVLWFSMTTLAGTEHGYAELGLYNAAYQWHGPMVFIPMILMSVSIPVLVQEWEAGRRERFRKITFKICGAMLAISLPPVALAALLSPWIMSLYGPGFRDGWGVLVLLLAAAPLNALAKISFGALFGMNRAWWILGTNLVWSVIMLSLVVWLVPTMGVTGLAIAFLAAYGTLGVLSFSLVLIGSGGIPASD